MIERITERQYFKQYTAWVNLYKRSEITDIAHKVIEMVLQKIDHLLNNKEECSQLLLIVFEEVLKSEELGERWWGKLLNCEAILSCDEVLSYLCTKLPTDNKPKFSSLLDKLLDRIKSVQDTEEIPKSLVTALRRFATNPNYTDEVKDMYHHLLSNGKLKTFRLLMENLCKDEPEESPEPSKNDTTKKRKYRYRCDSPPPSSESDSSSSSDEESDTANEPPTNEKQDPTTITDTFNSKEASESSAKESPVIDNKENQKSGHEEMTAEPIQKFAVEIKVPAIKPLMSSFLDWMATSITTVLTQQDVHEAFKIAENLFDSDVDTEAERTRFIELCCLIEVPNILCVCLNTLFKSLKKNGFTNRAQILTKPLKAMIGLMDSQRDMNTHFFGYLLALLFDEHSHCEDILKEFIHHKAINSQIRYFDFALLSLCSKSNKGNWDSLRESRAFNDLVTMYIDLLKKHYTEQPKKPDVSRSFTFLLSYIFAEESIQSSEFLDKIFRDNLLSNNLSVCIDCVTAIESRQSENYIKLLNVTLDCLDVSLSSGKTLSPSCYKGLLKLVKVIFTDQYLPTLLSGSFIGKH